MLCLVIAAGTPGLATEDFVAAVVASTAVVELAATALIALLTA